MDSIMNKSSGSLETGTRSKETMFLDKNSSKHEILSSIGTKNRRQMDHPKNT